MPIRNGKWVPWSQIEQTLTPIGGAGEPDQPEPEQGQATPRSRKSKAVKAAAAAAIQNATGIDITLVGEEESEQ